MPRLSRNSRSIACAPAPETVASIQDLSPGGHQPMASPDGETLSGDMALPYIVNFQMVDTDEDGEISVAEFKTACGKGWVQSADASTTKEMSPPAKL